jgi:hypothetical protein
MTFVMIMSNEGAEKAAYKLPVVPAEFSTHIIYDLGISMGQEILKCL